MTIDDLVKGSASLFDFFISTVVLKSIPNLLFNPKAFHSPRKHTRMTMMHFLWGEYMPIYLLYCCFLIICSNFFEHISMDMMTDNHSWRDARSHTNIWSVCKWRDHYIWMHWEKERDGASKLIFQMSMLLSNIGWSLHYQHFIFFWFCCKEGNVSINLEVYGLTLPTVLSFWRFFSLPLSWMLDFILLFFLFGSQTPHFFFYSKKI